MVGESWRKDVQMGIESWVVEKILDNTFSFAKKCITHCFRDTPIEMQVLQQSDFEDAFQENRTLQDTADISEEDIKAIFKILNSRNDFLDLIHEPYVYSVSKRTIEEIRTEFIKSFPEKIPLKKENKILKDESRESFLRAIFDVLDAGILKGLNRAANKGNAAASHAINIRMHAIDLQYTRKLIYSYSEVMEVEDENRSNILGWPILKDLKSGKKSEVYFDEETLTSLDEILTSSHKKRILLKGASGRGKTVLSRLLAYNKHKDNWDVYFIDIRETEFLDLGNLKKEMCSILRASNNPNLFIIENAHLSDEITEVLVSNADYLIDSVQQSNTHFLFNSRDFVRDKDIDPFHKWKMDNLCFEVKPDENLVKNIVNQYFDVNHKHYKWSQADCEWIRRNISPNNNIEADSIGGNLRLLRLYLIALSYKDCSLHELSEADVIVSLKRFILIDELSRDVILANLLGKISSIFQFDVPFYSKRVSYSDTKDYIGDLEKLRIKGTIKYIGKDFYTLTHSLDAYYISKCLASSNSETHEEFTAQCVREYIRELPKSPLNSIVDNLVKLFKSFYGDSQQSFEQRVFVLIYIEGREEIKDIIIKYCEGIGIPGQKYHEGLGILVRIIELIEAHLGAHEAFEFWEKLSAEINVDGWKRILQRNRPFYIVLLIKLLRRISPNEEIAIVQLNYILTKFGEIYEISTLHRLSELLKNLPDPVITQLTKQIEVSSFSRKIITSKPIYFEFIIKKLDEAFLFQVLSYIEQNEWDNFVEFIKKDEQAYRKTLLEKIRTINRDFERRLRSELKPQLEHARNRRENRRRSSDGRMLITNKIANNYSSNGLSYEDFRKHLSSNFETDFLISVDKIHILKRLIHKIIKSTYSHPEQEQGQDIIGKIIYQISDDLLLTVCLDLDFLELIQMANKQAYDYIGKRCKELS